MGGYRPVVTIRTIFDKILLCISLFLMAAAGGVTGTLMGRFIPTTLWEAALLIGFGVIIGIWIRSYISYRRRRWLQR